MGVIRLDKFGDHYTKLQKIQEKLTFLIRSYGAEEMAIEAPFYGKNAQSMLKLGRAQGVAIATGMTEGLPVAEYAPKKIKVAVTGNGNASKEQVAAMLKHLLKLQTLPKFFDATDALGVAVCHYLQTSSSIQSSGKKYGGWKDFIKDNPDKVK